MRNKNIIKILCFVIIQAYLLVNISWAGAGPVCKTEHIETRTLSPALNINMPDINVLFDSVCQNPGQIKDTAKQKPSQKRQSRIRNTFFIVKMLSFGLVLTTGALHLLNIFCPGFSLPADPIQAILLAILFMPITLLYAVGAGFTVFESYSGRFMRKIKSAFIDVLTLTKANLQYRLYRLKILKDKGLKAKTDEVLKLIFDHAEQGIQASAITENLLSESLNKNGIEQIIRDLEAMDIIDINNGLITNNLFHREYLHHIAKTINKKLDFQMPDKELYELTEFFQKKSYFIGLRENLVYSIPYIYMILTTLLFNGFGIEFSNIITQMSANFFAVQILVNFLLVVRIAAMPTTGIKLPISKTIIISEFNQFSMVEDAFIRAFNNGDIPEKMIIRSRAEIIRTISHESIHNIMDKYLGSKQNIKITNTIEALILEQDGIVDNDFDISIKPQRTGKVIDLVNQGRQLESRELSDKEKIRIAQKDAFDIAVHRYGTEREPAWSYCFGYILYGMLYERTLQENSYDNAWELIRELTNKNNRFEEAEETEKEPISNIFIRLSSAALSGSLVTWGLLLLSENCPVNTDTTTFDTIFINTALIVLVTAIGYLTGHMIAMAKYGIRDSLIHLFNSESISRLKAKSFPMITTITSGSLFAAGASKLFTFFKDNNLVDHSLSDSDLVIYEILLVAGCSLIGAVIGFLTSKTEPKIRKAFVKLKKRAEIIVKTSPRAMWNKFHKEQRTESNQITPDRTDKVPGTKPIYSALKPLRDSRFRLNRHEVNQDHLISQAI